MTSLYVLNPDIRIQYLGQQAPWRILDIRRKRRWQVGSGMIRVLAEFAAPVEIEGVMGARRAAIDSAITAGMLITSELAEPPRAWYANWQQRGWNASADLVTMLQGYPAHDYRTAESAVADEAADLRVQASMLEAIPPSEAMDRARQLIGSLSGSVVDAFRASVAVDTVAGADVVAVLAAGLGIVGQKTVNGRPALLGGRPSFGGLWNVTGYLIALDIDSVDAGVYRFDPLTSALERRAGGLSLDEVKKLIVGPVRAPFEPRAVVVLAIDWARLRARYADPGAFRSAFIELGHACGAVDMAAKAIGLRSFPQGGTSDREVAGVLGMPADSAENSIVFTITLGSGDRQGMR